MVFEKEKYLELLEELYKNSFNSLSTIGKKIGFTRQTISKMKDKLWHNIIINNPTILVNPILADLKTYLIEVKTNPTEPLVLENLKEFSEIEQIDGILGDYSLMLKVIVRSKSKFKSILENFDMIFTKSSFSAYRIIDIIHTYKSGGFKIEDEFEEDEFRKESLSLKESEWKFIQLLKRNYNIKKWREDSERNWDTFKGEYSPLSEEDINELQDPHFLRKFNKIKSLNIIQEFSIKYSTHSRFRGFNTKFYVRILPKSIGDYESLAKQLIQEPHIIDLYRTGETMGLLSVVRTDGIHGYNEFIKNLYKHYSIENTHSTVVVETNLPEMYPPTVKVAENVIKR